MSAGKDRSNEGPGYQPVVAVWRGDMVESVHHGAVAVVDSDGGLCAAVGDPGTRMFPRSGAKPAQAVPLIESGGAERFSLSDAEIALITGSHGGEPFHVEAVRSILAKIGLGEDALGCGVHPPLHPPAARALRAAGSDPTPLHNNCSGKHAGMLALAVHLGVSVADYLDHLHPVQRRIRAAIESLAGVAPGSDGMAIDGCSAPTLPLTLREAALIYARLVDPGGAGDGIRGAASRVAEAMRRHPEMVAGTDRLCTALMRASGRSLVAKIGAEGFYGLGFEQDGRGIGIALKIADGNEGRARNSLALEMLRRLEAITPETAADLDAVFVGDVRTHRGQRVGRMTTVFTLEATG